MGKNGTAVFAKSLVLAVSLIGMIVSCLVSASPMPDYYEMPGLMDERLYGSGDPNEYIDPFTGQLKLSYIDMVIPGRGGLDIVIERTYHSLTGGPASIDGHRLMPRGWDLHFGRVRTDDNQPMPLNCTYGLSAGIHTGNNPVLELPDGSRKTLLLPYTSDNASANEYRHPAADLITEDYWRANCLDDRRGIEVYSPDGLKYTFDQWGWFRGDSYAYHPTRIEDANGNYLTFEYHPIGTYQSPGNYFAAIKRIQSNDSRTVNFYYHQFGDNNNIRLKSIVYSGQTVFYESSKYPGTYDYKLDRVTRPDQSYWLYSYKGIGNLDEGAYSLETVLSPSKALTKYSYDSVFFAGSLKDDQGVIKQKTVYRDYVGNTPVGVWDYEYYPAAITTGTDLDTTLVKSPYGCVRYSHFGLDNVSQSYEELWKLGTLREKEIYNDTACTQSLQKELYEWHRWPVSPQKRPRSDYVVKADEDYYKPAMA